MIFYAGRQAEQGIVGGTNDVVYKFRTSVVSIPSSLDVKKDYL